MDNKNAVALWDIRVTQNQLQSTDIIDSLKLIAKHWVFQLETSDNGYVHFQGRISLIKKRRFAEKHLLLALFTTWKPEYLMPTTNPEFLNKSFSYVMKTDTRTDGPWSDVDEKNEIYIPRQYRDFTFDTLYPYQQTIWNSVQNTNFSSRFINLVYCPNGNQGKSTAVHVTKLRLGAVVVPAFINDAKELVQIVCDQCMDSRNHAPGAIFVDLPRALNKDKLYGVYTAIEVIKDGYLCDPRHKYKDWYIDSPQVWVFTNRYPDVNLLSLDRWNIWEINERHELHEYSPPFNHSDLDL